MDYDEVRPADSDVSLLQLHAGMFALADRYEVPDLLPVAANKCSVRCLASWKPLEFLSSVQDVYDGTPPSISLLRKTACTAIRRYLPAVLNDGSVSRHYDQIITENPDFAKDLLRSYVINPVFGPYYTCNSHQCMEVLQVRYKQCRKGQ